MNALEEIVGPEQAAALDALAAELGPSDVCVLAADSGAYAAQVADVFAHRLGPPADQRRFAPDKGRYTVAELDAVVSATALRPVRRNVCVLAAAETLDDVSASRLLKTVESPPAPSVFLFAMPARSTLPTALAGRVAHTFRLATLGHDLAAAQIAAQLDAHRAEELVELCAPRYELAVALASARDVDKVLTGLRALAGVNAFSSPGDLQLDVFDAFPTTATHDVVALCLDRFEDDIRLGLATNRGGVGHIAALANARSLLHRHASPVSVLMAVLTRTVPPFEFPGRSRLRAWAV